MAHPRGATILARKLRKNQTRAEEILWQVLRARRLNGVKFQRQFPIVYSYVGGPQFYIVDFYCHQYKLAIELDGNIHEHFQEHDKARDECLMGLGIRTLRLQNTETKCLKEVQEKILSFILRECN